MRHIQQILVSFTDGSGISSTDEGSSSDSTFCPETLVQVDQPCTTMPVCTSHSEEDSDIEVLVGDNISISASAESLLQSAMRWEGDVSNSTLLLSADTAASDGCSNQNLERWECEGACTDNSTPEVSDDYVVLDGYESDVDSELSGSEELQQSL